MSKKNQRALAVGGLVVAAALSACGGGGGGGQGSSDITLKAADSLRFDPTTISAKVGQKVNVAVQNAGAMPHSLVIDELKVNSGPVAGGQRGSVSFTPRAAGSFTFYCDMPGHKASGMMGTLTVTQ